VISRRCSKAGCSAPAVATLTYAYVDSTAVVGPLALRSEPGNYDLCVVHCTRLSTPRGWELIRLPLDPHDPRHSADDLVALADAVREAARRYEAPQTVAPVLSRRIGHLGVVAEPSGGRR
jgi:Protein of unknown function (DUF3499)